LEIDFAYHKGVNDIKTMC